MYGPTTGDKTRFADTSLCIEIGKDYTFYRDECVFFGGKVIRDTMGQDPLGSREKNSRSSYYQYCYCLCQTGNEGGYYKYDYRYRN
ncbi:hypothetical protein [Bacteroidetes bacterium endosymbiont of Geopemphigus sp.]